MGLNYFSEKELVGQLKFQHFRDSILGPLGNLLVACGVTPNLVTLVSFLSLFGVAYFAGTEPVYAFWFLVVHVVLDAFDGLVARLTGSQSDAGAFFDILNDHYGIVIFTGVLLYWGVVDSVTGYIYAHLYTLLIILILLRNQLGVPAKYVFRTKYWVYAAYGLLVFTQINLLEEAVMVFSVIMIPSIFVSIRALGLYLKQHGN